MTRHDIPAVVALLLAVAFTAAAWAALHVPPAPAPLRMEPADGRRPLLVPPCATDTECALLEDYLAEVRRNGF